VPSCDRSCTSFCLPANSEPSTPLKVGIMWRPKFGGSLAEQKTRAPNKKNKDPPPHYVFFYERGWAYSALTDVEGEAGNEGYRDPVEGDGRGCR
jgi:hypothetical protein